MNSNDEATNQLLEEYVRAARSVRAPGCIGYSLALYAAIVIVQILTGIVFFAIVVTGLPQKIILPNPMLIILALSAAFTQLYLTAYFFKRIITPLEKKRDAQITEIERTRPQFRQFYTEWRKHRIATATSIVATASIVAGTAVGKLAIEAYKKEVS